MKLANILNIELERLGHKSIQQKADACRIGYEVMRQILKGKPASEERIIEIGKAAGLSDQIIASLILAKIEDSSKTALAKNFMEKLIRSYASVSEDANPYASSIAGGPHKPHHTVPVFASVRTGFEKLSEKCAEIVDEVLLTAEEYEANCFALQFNGANMAAELISGDIGIFEPPGGLQPAENDIVAIELEGHGQWLIKRLKIPGSGKIRLISASKDQSAIDVCLNTEKLEIKGILLRTVRTFKKRLFLK